MPPLASEKLAWVRELYCDKGVSQDRIARIVGVPKASVENAVRAFKFVKATPSTALTAEEIRVKKRVRTAPQVQRFMDNVARPLPDLGLTPLCPNITFGHQHLNGLGHGSYGPRKPKVKPAPPPTCEWPLDGAGANTTRRCGQPTHAKHPYCQEHCRVAYTSWIPS